MPSFLDFIIPFGKQVCPQDSHFSGLREDTRFAPQADNTVLVQLGRSDSGLRLCYNLRSVEPTEGDPLLPWTIHHSAVYHCFDTNTSIALWIVVNENDSIETRLTEATQGRYIRPRPMTGPEAFSATLKSHLIMCDWSGGNWRSYINDLENQLQSLIKHVYTTKAKKEPVPSSPTNTQGFALSSRSRTFASSPLSPATICNDPPNSTGIIYPRTMSGTSSSKIGTRTSTSGGNIPSPQAQASNAGNGLELDPDSNALVVNKSSTNSFPVQDPLVSSLAKTRAWMERSNDTTNSMSTALPAFVHGANEEWVPQEKPLEMVEQDSEEPHEHFSFRDLQRIQHIEEKAQEIHLVLGFNIQVLIDLRAQYESVVEDVNFPEDLKEQCQEDLSIFDRRILGKKKNLQMLQSRTRNLLDRLANRKSLVSAPISS
jgi:hypothetical protein